MKVWDTPTIGSGAHASSETIAYTALMSFEENIVPNGKSTLTFVVDNSAGTYDTLPTTHIKKGAIVQFGYGYTTSVGAETTGGEDYFIENWTHARQGNKSVVIFENIDGWGLLEKYKIPKSCEINFCADELTAYELIEKLIACIGGTVTNISASTLCTTLYPRLVITAGESGAEVLRRILNLLEDVLKFEGVNCDVLQPQTSDTYGYTYTFPT